MPLLFVAVLVRLRIPATEAASGPIVSDASLRPAFRFVRRQPAVLAVTLMFMAFNLGEGILLVVLPILARQQLAGDASTYGILLSSFALATTMGSLVVGALRWPWTLGRSIAIAQTAAGVALLGLALVRGVVGVVAVLIIAGVLVSPMTIWAQTVRMRVIPAELRGRTFGLLRTLMQSTPPIGGAAAGLLLGGGGQLSATILAAGLVMTVPGAIGLVAPALADEHTRARDPREPTMA